MALYSKVEYWNERYNASRNLAPYDWYQNYTSLSHLLNPETLSGCARPTHSLSPNTLEDNSSDSTEAVDNGTRTKSYYLLQPDKCRVLILGCGNSTFGADMYEAGWTGGKKNENGARFVQVDFSPVVIEQMKQRYGDDYYRTLLGASADAATRMEFLCHDVTESPLPLENGSFDLIICKGIFDAILCSAGSVANIRRLVQESVRLLSDDGGVLLVCTYGNPDNRVVFLEDAEGELNTYWHGVSIHTVPSTVRAQKSGTNSTNKNDYVYVCRKRSGAWKDGMASWASVGPKNKVSINEGVDSNNGDNAVDLENQPGISDESTTKLSANKHDV